jgi:hypothetical protein
MQNLQSKLTFQMGNQEPIDIDMIDEGKTQSPKESWFDLDANLRDIGTHMKQATGVNPLQLDPVSCITYFTNLLLQINDVVEWCVKV